MEKDIILKTIIMVILYIAKSTHIVPKIHVPTTVIEQKSNYALMVMEIRN